MTRGQIVLVVAGIALQAALSAALGAHTDSQLFSGEFLGYAIMGAVLWGLVVTIVRSKNRELMRWLQAAFLIGPLLTMIILLFASKKAQEIP